jgi:hypothetical protein
VVGLKHREVWHGGVKGMAWAKYAAAVVGASVVVVGACRTSEASSSSSSSSSLQGKPEASDRAGPVGAASASERVKTEGARGPRHTPLDKSPVLLRWIYDRYSLVLKKDEAIEEKNKAGIVLCSITENAVSSALGAAKLNQLKGAIKALGAFRGSTRRNPIFRPYSRSRELIAFIEGQEFLVEMMYQAQEVISPPSESHDESFERNFALVLDVARQTKLCPDLDDSANL